MNKLDLMKKNNFNSVKSSVVKKRRVKAIATDLAIVTGALVSDEICMDEDNSLKTRYTSYWIKSDSVSFINREGKNINIEDSREDTISNIGIRPVLPLDEVDPDYIIKMKRDSYNNQVIEYGNIYQDVPSDDIVLMLDKSYKNKELTKSNKQFIVNGLRNFYEEKKCDEYLLDNKKYLRVEVNNEDEVVTLSNGKKYKNEEYVWLEEKPIEWYLDLKTETLVSKKCLVAGVNYQDVDLYLNTISNHIFDEKYLTLKEELSKVKKKLKK